MPKLPITISQIQRAFEQLPKDEEKPPYFSATIPFKTLELEGSPIGWPAPVTRLKLLFEWNPDLNKWVLDTSEIDIVNDDFEE